MNAEDHHQPPLQQSPRFQPPPTRRDFLGMAAVWSAMIAFAGAVLGSLRLPMPAVFPESNPKVKIGLPEKYPQDSITRLEHLNAWVFHDEKGLYAISAICTHLGCITARDPDTGVFHCPCHGSIFGPAGKVRKGPAPKPLNWLAMSVASDGQLVIDQWQFVSAGTRLTV